MINLQRQGFATWYVGSVNCVLVFNLLMPSLFPECFGIRMIALCAAIFRSLKIWITGLWCGCFLRIPFRDLPKSLQQKKLKENSRLNGYQGDSNHFQWGENKIKVILDFWPPLFYRWVAYRHVTAANFFGRKELGPPRRSMIHYTFPYPQYC